jgi:two-component system LytT family response regulator
MLSNGSLACLIIDDELQSRLLIHKLLESHDASIIIHEADSVTSALQEMNKGKPDLIFLDIQLRGETGFDFLDKAGGIDIPVIFTTAHSEHAVRAFRYSAFDYLLKPIDFTEFEDVLHKALRRLTLPQETNSRYAHLRNIMESETVLPLKLTIPTSDGFLFMETNDILYCAASGNYTEFFLSGRQKVMSSYTLGHYEELLEGKNFFRVHRSFLINLRHIKMYRRGDGGNVVMQDGKEIEVSRANKDAFLKLFKA